MSFLPPIRFVSAPLLPLAVALCGGIVLQHYAQLNARSILIGLLTLTLSATLACIAFLKKRKLLAAALMLLVVFFGTGILLVWLTERAPGANRISRLYDERLIAPGDPVELSGVVAGEPEPAPQSFYLTLRVERLRFRDSERPATGTVMLLARMATKELEAEYDLLELRHGARIRVMAKLDREDDFRNPGVSPFTEYLERKGFDATGTIKSPSLIERLDDESVFLPLAWVYSWRGRLQSEFQRHFTAETAGVLSAALLGNPHNISRPTAQRFRAGGTFHILVISGLQIAFVAGVVFLIVRRFTQRKLLQFLLAASFIWAYAVAVGAEASVTRAALMFTLAAFAPAVARRTNSLNAVAGAGLLLLIVKPNDLFDPSFQLTFLSVVAIVCLALPLLETMRQVGSWRPTMVTPYPPRCSSWFRQLSESLFWSEREWRAEMAASNIKYRLFKAPIAAKLERWRIQRPLRYALSAIVISASVQVVLLPLMVLYFHRVSFASLLLNIFVGGLMAVLGVTALIAIAVAQISSVVAAPFMVLAEKTNSLMIHLVDPFASFGLASLRLPHYSGWAAGVYALYFVLLLGLIVAAPRWNPLRAQPAFSRGSWRIVRLVGISFAVVLIVVLTHPFSAARSDGRLHVEFLDVGQGDCALITAPDGTTILIDGGGQPSIDWERADSDDGESPFERDTRSIGERVVSEFLWARGLDRVDYLIATHADADHIDGLNDVAQSFRVHGAIVGRAPLDNPQFVRLTRTLNESGVPIQVVTAGDVITIGSISIEVLWPPPSNIYVASSNNESLVLRLRFGEKSFLFAADIEKEAEAALLRSGIDLQSDVVRVPHHGSRTSSTAPFVEAVRPTLAVISVGRYSIFGHPGEEVVERWRARGAQVMTTGERGTISVVTDGKDLNVSVLVTD